MREVEISREPVELYKLLKFESLVNSGGQAKFVISEGEVLVNGEVETRKRKKLVSGDMVEFAGEKLILKLISSEGQASSKQTRGQASGQARGQAKGQAKDKRTRPKLS